MIEKPFVAYLRRLDACHDAIKWVITGKFHSAKQAWDACNRGDWMLWLIGRQITSEPWSDDRKPLLLCALECALTVKRLWPKKQAKQIGEAVGILKKWANGKVSVEAAKKARTDLYAAYAANAAYGANAAVYAANAAAAVYPAAAANAAYAAANAAYAAYAAYAANAAAAVYPAAAAAMENNQKLCAKIVRKHFPKAPKARNP